MIEIRLLAGRQESLLRRHPWVYSGAISEIRGVPVNGETVRISTHAGDFLAWGAFSESSKIRVRVWSFDPDVTINADFFSKRISESIQLRQAFIPEDETNAWRLIHAESDYLPGLIVDRYANCLVIQVLSSGVEYWRDTLVSILATLPGISSIYERSDVDVRNLEGLPPRSGLLHGKEPDQLTQIRENSLKFGVDVRHGQKTGFFLDQRENRRKIRTLASGRSVLDCFSYTGGFTVNAQIGGATSVSLVDESENALELAQENLERNNLLTGKTEFIPGNVFQVLRLFRDQGRKFDLIILDPPKFAPTASLAERAARGYKDINLLAFKLLNPQGRLVTFSCSGGINADLFKKIVSGAALDAGVNAAIVDTLHAGPDHPVSLSFPEGAYLKGLVIQLA